MADPIEGTINPVDAAIAAAAPMDPMTALVIGLGRAGDFSAAGGSAFCRNKCTTTLSQCASYDASHGIDI